MLPVWLRIHVRVIRIHGMQEAVNLMEILPDELGAVYMGFGLYKSTDNGVTWTQLPLNTITDYNGSLLAAGSLDRYLIILLIMYIKL